jgi:hypothetical protein
VLAAFLLSIIVSFLTLRLFDAPGDETYSQAAFGILWSFVFVVEASRIIPLSLGVTAELVERKVHGWSFRLSKALLRFLIALPIGVAPLYAAVFVIPYIESYRPADWIEKEVLLCSLSGVFAYLALRIRQNPVQPNP